MKLIYGLYKIYFFTVVISTLIIFYPLLAVLLNNPKNFPFVFKLKRFWAWLVCVLCGVIVDIKGKQNIKDETYVVCANHMSYFDIVMMYRVVPYYFVFMGKAELEKWPLFGVFFKKKMDIAVNRGSVRASFNSLQRASDQLSKGNSVAIFPEGTISENIPHMLRFKNGAFQMALKQNVKVLPISFLDNYKRLSDPEKLWLKNLPGISKVIIHKPIQINAGNLKEDLLLLRDKTFKTIQKELL